MGKYYFLIAGLQELSLDDSKVPVAVTQFRDEVYDALDGADRKLMDLLLLENDCRNLISLLRSGTVQGGETDMRPCLFGAEQLEELISCVKAQERCPSGIPQFMYDFVEEWQDESWHEVAEFPEDRLWGLFYDYALQCGNDFVQDWYRFNLDLNNIQIAITGRKFDLDVRRLFVGDNAITHALRTSGARDWGLSQELSFWDDIMLLQEAQDLNDRERKTDMLRWKWLEQNSFFHYFTVERLFSYMVRLGMVERWTSMDREQGQKLFRKLIGELKDQTEVPSGFRVN